MNHDHGTRPYALIVDDNPVILLQAADMLEDAGFCTFAAADCHQALACLAEHGKLISLLFANVMIPGPMNGLELAHFAHGKSPSLSIIVTSGQVVPADGVLPDDAVFLAKPFSPDEVRDAVGRVFQQRNPETLGRLSLQDMCGFGS